MTYITASASGDPARDPLVVRLRDLPVEETLAAFAELVTSSPDHADVAALALREQGREGRLDADHLEALITCLEAAPNALCIGHLAKALATLGRAAGAASEPLIERLEEQLISDDVAYWSVDGAIWALGYLGGTCVAPFLDQLASENPNRAVRSQSLYRGAMPKEARDKAFRAAIEGARALLLKADPGVWRTAKMTVKRAGAAPKVTGKAWDLRAATAEPKKVAAGGRR